MAQRQGCGIGGVGRLRQAGQLEAGLHHLLHLLLAGPAVAGDGILDLVGRVLNDLAPGRRRLAQRQPARLPDAHRGADVDLEEHLLDSDHVGPELLEQVDQLGSQGGEPLRQRIGGRGADHAHRHRNARRVRRARRPRRSRIG